MVCSPTGSVPALSKLTPANHLVERAAILRDLKRQKEEVSVLSFVYRLSYLCFDRETPSLALVFLNFDFFLPSCLVGK